jgi:iron complex outermembrane receptor protein
LFVNLLIAASSHAMQVDTLVVALPELRIEALRASETPATAPFAVSMLARSPEALSLEHGLSLENVLRGLPGVLISDRSHYALGERILIRGMGWRSSFGVRGIQVLLDGVPLTLPDGQAVLDIVDPAFIRQAEIVRGPSSTFWGNGSGGVLLLSTEAFRDSSSASARAMGGSYGARQLSADAALPIGNHRLHGFVSSNHNSGFREHAAGGFDRSAVHGSFDLGPRTRLRVTGALAVQDVESPGSLTLEQVAANPAQADSRNVSANAGKKSTQVQVGATLHHQTRVGLLSTTAYGLVRRLDNPLSFAYIDLNRLAGGARVQLQIRRGQIEWGLGTDIGVQSDERFNYDNAGGVAGPDLELYQREDVRALAAFLYARLELATGLSATAAIRADDIGFALRDRFVTDGDQSGDRSFSAFSPSIGISYGLGPAMVFANVSSAFETPTTTELVNQPDGSPGLNADVGAQRTLGVEAGARGSVGRLLFDAALFRLHVTDRLLPFQDDEGRTYYRNAGENIHSGVEVALRMPIAPGVVIQATYTGSRFLFEDESLSGNRIPGVPAHHVFVGASMHRGGVWGQVSTEFIANMFADDANETTNDGYAVADIGVGYTSLFIGGAHVQPFASITNVLNTRYVGSLVVNAFGGRYFEPSPGRTLQFGVRVSL